MPPHPALPHDSVTELHPFRHPGPAGFPPWLRQDGPAEVRKRHLAYLSLSQKRRRTIVLDRDRKETAERLGRVAVDRHQHQRAHHAEHGEGSPHDAEGQSRTLRLRRKSLSGIIF